MAEVTMKSTKAEILEAYEKVKTELDNRKAQTDDPVAEQAKKEVENTLKVAKEIAESGILNPVIVEKYDALQKAAEIKEKEIKELYGIEVEANALVALINTHKEKERELTEKYKVLNAELVKQLEDKKAVLNDEIAELEAIKKTVLLATSNENQQLYAQLKKEREREAEEYAYDLKRSRKLAEDKWEDEKNAREKALAEREANIAEREKALIEKEDKVLELEKKVAEIPTLVTEATAEGKKQGKADADKSHVFEVRTLNTKNEYEQNALRDQIARLESSLSDERAKNVTLQEKLDAAYAQMKELASETVKSTGGVKILNNENTGKYMNK